MRSGLLCRLLHLGRILGVEVLLVDGDESDVGGLPDAEDEGIASGRQLPPRLLDRKLGQVRGPGLLESPCQSALSVATWVVMILRRRSLASSGGEYQAGFSPARKSSRSGVCGWAPPRA